MSSCFSDLYTIEYFSMGFDLIEDHLPESVITWIITDIWDLLEEYPDSRDAVLALEALNDAIGERDEAIAALMSYVVITESSIATLRMARQLMLSGEEEKAKDLLLEIIRRKGGGSSLGQLCALLASARLNDEEAFAGTWRRLVEEYDLKEPFSVEELIRSPDTYTLLGDLPFREQIEGLEYLFSYRIHENREAETFALVHNLRTYLENVQFQVHVQIKRGGIIRCLPALPVVKAISDGSIEVAEKIFLRYDPVSDDALFEKIDEDIERIRLSGKKAIVLSEIAHWSFDPVQPVDEILSTVRRHSGGDDEPIIEMLDLISTELPVETARELLSALLAAHPDDRCLIECLFEVLTSGCRYNEALAIAERYPFLKQDGDAFDELTLNALDSSDKEAVFLFLLGRMKERRMLTRYPDLFEMALALDRMDDVSALREVFAAEKVPAGLHLLNALDRLKKKDVKGGMALIERAKASGLPEGLALMIPARALMSAGYPKRVVGLCEKMLKKTLLPPEEIYPLLIRAYRDLGRESEAHAAEALFEALR